MKPKGAGANVFDLDPNNHASITGRTQPKGAAAGGDGQWI